MERIQGRDTENIFNNIPLFTKLSRKSLFFLSENASRKQYSANSVIFEEGDESDCMYVILKGGVQIYITSDNYQTVNLSILEKGEYFGEQAFLPNSSGQRTASAIALQDTHLLQITKDLFQTCLLRDSTIVKDLTTLGAEQLRFRLAQESALFRTLPLGKIQGQWLKEKSFSAGEVIFREGDIGDNFYLILWGSAKITKTIKGREEEIGYSGPGQYFGELALINQAPRVATVTADSELLTLSLSGNKFISLYESSPQLRSHMDNLSGIYKLPGKGFITMHPSTLSGFESTTTLYHYALGVQLAFTKTLDKPICSISNTANKTTDKLNKITYINNAEGIYRELLLNNKTVVSATCHGLWNDLGHLLETCLQQKTLNRWQIALFQTEGELRLFDASNDLSDQAVICKCTGVTRGILKQGMAEGCKSVSDLSEKTGAARVCGSCAPLIAEMTGRTDMQLADLIEVIPVTHNIKSFRFRNKFGETYPSLPSQHIRVEGQINGHWVHRTYTLTSPANQTDYYEITVKRETKGLFSQWLHDDVTKDDFIRISKPQGGYKFPDDPAIPYVFFAAGIGITPALAIVRSVDKQHKRELYLEYSAHSRSDISYADELDNASEENSNLTINLRNTDQHPRIQLTDVQRLVKTYPSAHIFICGPSTYQADIRELASDCNIAADRIHIENFHPTGDINNSIPELIGAKTAYTFSSITLILALFYLVFPAISYEQTVQGGWKLESVWLSFELKQITGYTIAGLAVTSMLISLRKRIKSINWGRFAWWRLAHIFLAILGMIILFFHTGFSLGNNYNQALILIFITITMLGAITMLLKLLMVHIQSNKLQKIQTKINLAHIIASSVLPALLAVHILKAYYFH